MGPGAVGISEAAARAFVARLGFEKTAQEHPLLVRRPNRIRESLDEKGSVEKCVSEEAYTPGALARLVMSKLGGAPMLVTVRTGREAYGHLPKAPEFNERHFSAPDAKGAIMALLDRAGRLEKKAQATTMAATQEHTPAGQIVPFGPWSSLTENLRNSLLGAGAGRALLFLAAGKNAPVGLERAIMAGGGALGYGIGKRIKHEQGRQPPQHAPVAYSRPAMSLDEALRQLPQKDEDRQMKGELRRDIISAMAGGAAGAVVPEAVGALKARLARAAARAI